MKQTIFLLFTLGMVSCQKGITDNPSPMRDSLPVPSVAFDFDGYHYSFLKTPYYWYNWYDMGIGCEDTSKGLSLQIRIWEPAGLSEPDVSTGVKLLPYQIAFSVDGYTWTTNYGMIDFWSTALGTELVDTTYKTGTFSATFIDGTNRLHYLTNGTFQNLSQ